MLVVVRKALKELLYRQDSVQPDGADGADGADGVVGAVEDTTTSLLLPAIIYDDDASCGYGDVTSACDVCAAYDRLPVV